VLKLIDLLLKLYALYTPLFFLNNIAQLLYITIYFSYITLGFDFDNKKPSKYFTISIVIVQDKNINNAFRIAVRKTLRNKVNRKRKKPAANELKGYSLSKEHKYYTWKSIHKENFKICSVTINKKELPVSLTSNKSRLYNFVALRVIENIPEEILNKDIEFVIDRSKGKKEIWELDKAIENILSGKVDINKNINIVHADSVKLPGLQFADIFSYGIYSKYEKKSLAWYNRFKEKMIFDINLSIK
ncbi:MAG: DUF3800 domain-containing protein, partial [Victivallales bacterium]|nr:DUF3800 domain-containing protein [Victivallales bacterium]